MSGLDFYQRHACQSLAIRKLESDGLEK
jgi:hypothetical protein